MKYNNLPSLPNGKSWKTWIALETVKWKDNLRLDVGSASKITYDLFIFSTRSIHVVCVMEISSHIPVYKHRNMTKNSNFGEICPFFVLRTIVMNLCSCPRSLYSWGKIETIDRIRNVEKPPSCYELRQLPFRSKLQIFALVARPNCWTDWMFATKLW